MPRARPPSSPSLAAAAAVTASTSTSTSTILNHTYAPFYACYLLKSYNPKRLNQTYIGSTPDPPRRWRQHMGETVGGVSLDALQSESSAEPLAVLHLKSSFARFGLVRRALTMTLCLQAFKTRLARPWEMEAIVYGFPTKLQALQFEWAWQNPHASRLLHAVPVATPETEAAEDGSESEPAAAATTPTKGRKKSGSKPKAVKKKAAPKPVAQFPRTAASNRGQTRIQVLQYMLTVPPWRSFNLRVMLFSDLARTWWGRAKLAGPTVRTDAGWNKFEKLLEKEKGKGRETDDVLRVRDAWGERATWLERVQVDLRREGVDGDRLVRIGERQEQDAIGRMRIDDGALSNTHRISRKRPSTDVCLFARWLVILAAHRRLFPRAVVEVDRTRLVSRLPSLLAASGSRREPARLTYLSVSTPR
jgi:structure-specific endonuclease subunit SLX1